MARINLPHGYYLNVSPGCYTLINGNKVRIDKKGNPVEPAPLGYYGNFPSAIKGFKRIYTRAELAALEGSLALDEAVAYFKKEDKELDELLSKLKEY